VAGEFAVVEEAIQYFAAFTLARVGTARCDWAGDTLEISPAVTRDGDWDVAGWTTAWVAEDVTPSVCAVFMLLAIAVLSTGMGKNQGGEFWLVILPTEAVVLGHYILCVGVVAVGTGPAVES